MENSRRPQSDVGTYGLRISGLPYAGPLLSPAEADAPLLHIERRSAESTVRGSGVGEERAQFELTDGAPLGLQLWRSPLRARFTGWRIHDDQTLVHPYLAVVAATAGYWLDWDAFHAGAFRLVDTAWAVLGARGDGKSTLLARLAQRGVDVLSDDLCMIDRGEVLAGPNAIDLRADAAGQLRTGHDVGVIGGRERWRVTTAPSSARTRLGGWISLRWADEFALRRIPPSRLVPALLANPTLKLPVRRPERLLSLAALPGWELSRPEGWAELDSACDVLMDGLAES